MRVQIHMPKLQLDADIAHHIKGFRPALAAMKELGFSEEQCLATTGIIPPQLEMPDQSVSLQQELAFYRRILQLSADPLIGLKLGQAYRLESYGVFGYAILSAQNLREALDIASQYSPLSFTHFHIGSNLTAEEASLYMERQYPFDPALLQLYGDRDFAAIVRGTEVALGTKFPLNRVHLMHDGSALKKQYEAAFGCPVSFNHERMALFFEPEYLETPMPLRDPETCDYCRSQCQWLLEKLTSQQTFSEQVRQRLLTISDALPNVTEFAKQLNVSERTLRRRLSEEEQSFQQIVNELRFELAKNYLKSSLSLERISEMLGFSESTNFSHAFKRWSGQSPSHYRKSWQKPERNN